jgi:hypothetical protein
MLYRYAVVYPRPASPRSIWCGYKLVPNMLNASKPVVTEITTTLLLHNDPATIASRDGCCNPQPQIPAIELFSDSPAQLVN